MSALELCPLSDHLEESEIESLVSELASADVRDIEFAEEADPVPIEQDYDDDVFIDFWDQLEANEAACDIYLPVEFEDVFEIDGRRIGSAHALVLVLANIKEGMFIDDDDDDDDDTEAIEDIDDELDEFDEYGSEEEDHFEGDDESPIGAKDEHMRRVWRALNKAAKVAVAQQIALFVHD